MNNLSKNSRFRKVHYLLLPKKRRQKKTLNYLFLVRVFDHEDVVSQQSGDANLGRSDEVFFGVAAKQKGPRRRRGGACPSSSPSSGQPRPRDPRGTDGHSRFTRHTHYNIITIHKTAAGPDILSRGKIDFGRIIRFVYVVLSALGKKNKTH